MSSADVAAYLYEVGSNQRKLQYCRQILAANTNFIPACIFSMKPPHSTNTQTKSQFIDNIRNLGLGCSATEEELIFSYFQLDSKTYITYDEFEQLILPQTDQSYKKLIGKRKGQDFVLDYALRFSLQKYFFQIIENQVKLQLMCKFTFAKDKKDEKKLRPKRLDYDSLAYFMNAHSKYPDKKTCELIVREINLNKGENRRNVLIVQYLLQFNDKHKHKQPLPTVAFRDVTFVPPPTRKAQPFKPNENKENKINNYQKSRYIIEENKPGVSAYHELANSFIVAGNQTHVGTSISAINEVENRIKMLMSEVTIKTPNLSNLQISRGPPRKQQKAQKAKEEIQKVPQLKNSILQQIRQQLKKEKEGKSQLRQDSNFKNITIKSRREMTDREFEQNRNDLELETANKNKTDRIFQSKIKKGQSFSFELENESFGSSQVVFKPKNKPTNSPSITASDKLKQLTKSNKYEYLNTNKQKPAEEGKKRIQYLKSLIQQKDIAKR